MVLFSLRSFFIFTSTFLLCSACNRVDGVRYYGNFEAQELLLPAGGTGKVIAMFVNEGDVCDSGLVVAIVDTTLLALERERVTSAIEALRASLPDVSAQLAVLIEKKIALEGELSRIENLIRSGSANETMANPVRDKISLVHKEYEAAKSGLARNERAILSQIGAMESELEMIGERIGRCYLRTPFRADVLEINVKEGEYVAEGTPVISLAKSGTINFMAWVPGSDLFSITPGDSVLVFCDRPKGNMEHYGGVVVHVSERPQFLPSMVQTRESRVGQHYKVTVSLENDGSVKPGMPGELVPIQ
ncbi:MAG: HlyD family efflux transporter periplasmic adaptor subunit [Bacteroidia bacterium]|nr:HlyD family efflux transporter periplasmic adaptor subunit [Bacteroidia bacterium]